MDSLIFSGVWVIARGFPILFTFVLLLSSMNSPILSKAIAEVKVFTLVKLLSGVCSHVFGKVKAVGKGFATFSTFMRFLSNSPLISGKI